MGTDIKTSLVASVVFHGKLKGKLEYNTLICQPMICGISEVLKTLSVKFSVAAKQKTYVLHR